MDSNDSTHGPVMVFCETFTNLVFHKTGEFLHKLSATQERFCILELFTLPPQNKFPLDRGGDDTWGILNSTYCSIPLPSDLSTSRRCLSLRKDVITNIHWNNMCNMPGKDYKELLQAGEGSEQLKGKVQRGNTCDFFLWPQYCYCILPILWSCWGLSPFPVSDDWFPSCLPAAAVKKYISSKQLLCLINAFHISMILQLSQQE